MKQRILIIISIGCATLVVLVSVLAFVFLFNSRNGDTNAVNKLVNNDFETYKISDKSDTTNSSPKNLTYEIPKTTSMVKFDITATIFNKKNSDRLFISEVEILKNVYEVIASKNINNPSKLPVSLPELDSSLIQRAIENERDRDTRDTIPANLEQLFLGPGAVEIEALLLEAYDEFIEFLKTKGVHQKYIDEFITNTLPRDKARIRYEASNTSRLPAVAKKHDGSGDDYSQIMITFRARHFYNDYLTFKSSDILGDVRVSDADKFYRDMGVRFTAFHEFTHALQRAYANLHLPAKEKTFKTYIHILDSKGISLMQADDSKFKLSWGMNGILDLLHNQVVSEERQSDSIAFEGILAVYKMSDAQVAQLRDHVFGRLYNARDILNEVIPAINTKNSQIDLSQLGTILVDSFVRDLPIGDQRTTLTSIVYRLDNLPAYVGYFNQMTPSELNKLWVLLSK